MKFTATTTGPDKLDLRQRLEDFASEQWLPDHLADEQRVDWVLDQFARTVAGELKLLGLEIEASTSFS